MKLSVVTTLYYSEPHLNEFYQRMSISLKQLVGDSYEIIFVNDGSPDQSLRDAIALTNLDAHIKVIDLSANFGHHKAIMTGLKHAKGDQIFIIDSDLEEEPEILIDFYEQLNNKKCDLLYGVQQKRKGYLFEQATGFLFYKIFNSISNISLPTNISTVRLMTRRYLNALLQHEEREIYIHGLCQIVGFEQEKLIIKKGHTSPTTYTLRRKFSLLIDAITSFSQSPLVGVFYIGGMLTLFSILYILYLVTDRILFGTPVTGWTSLMASIWFLSGLTISILGVIGIYLSKVFLEVKQRPSTVIREIYSYDK